MVEIRNNAHNQLSLSQKKWNKTEEQREPWLSIHFGNTNTIASVCVKNKIMVIETIPSILMYPDGGLCLVGKQAANLAKSDQDASNKAIINFKKLLAQSARSDVVQESSH